MTVKGIAAACGFGVLVEGQAAERGVESVYCCDLLSFVMGRAPADSAWVTVMGNVNAIAVAVLADVACIVLAEGAALDDEARAKAQTNGVTVLATAQPVYEAAAAIDRERVR